MHGERGRLRARAHERCMLRRRRDEAAPCGVCGVVERTSVHCSGGALQSEGGEGEGGGGEHRTAVAPVRL